MIPWEQIKNHWRAEFSQTEVYTDENEHIIVFKSYDTFILIGYLHYRYCSGITSDYVIEFIDFIKNLGNRNFKPFKIYLLSNCKLSKINEPSEILSLPCDVQYYYVNFNSFYDSIKLDLENRIESAKNLQNLEKFNISWYYNRNIPIISDSRFEEWEKWEVNGYRRKWFNKHEVEKFDDFIDQFDFTEIEWYLEDRNLLGFYIIWK